MKKRFLLTVCLSALIVSMSISCKGKGVEGRYDGDELNGNISISGAFALYPLAVKWSEEFQKMHPGVRIDLSAGGAGKGMTDVLADVVDLGMVSREVYDAELEKGAVPFATAKDAVVITINADNPFAGELMKKGISKETATKIWITGEDVSWGQVLGTNDATPVHVYTRSDACGAAETFAMWMGHKQEDLRGTAVFGDPGLASAVQADKLAVGLNNIGYAYDEKSRKPNPGLLVVPIDRDNDGVISSDEYFYDTKDDFIAAVSENKYPSPPARDLYLVSHGVPTNPVVVAFLEYVLGDGQCHNVPTGYIGIDEEKLQRGRELLKK
ncbi:MAG: PstS family phosphate ABC transporter substrate-binding protein [Bacteroidales bacterium]|nr:PstS family phosphate ABC transporter substrate-binding protein [Bacteroidales bacterium]